MGGLELVRSRRGLRARTARTAQTARQVTATARFDGPWALLVDGAAWTADTADTGADTVVTWLVGRLEPGASRTSTLRAIPGSNGGDGPITFTVENR